MRRILIVAYFFPPIAASGSMRPLAFVRYLRDYGWDPIVLAAHPSSVAPLFATDATLSSSLPPGVPVHRIPHRSMLQTAIDIRDRVHSAIRAQTSAAAPPGSLPPPNTAADSWLRRCRAGVSRAKEATLRHLFVFPDTQASWLRPAVRHASALFRHEPVDAILATGSPWTGLLVGLKLTERFGVPLIADFRDPWTHNSQQPWNYPTLVGRARALERRVCDRARCVVANTEALRAQFQADYPEMRDKFIAIPNGFDETLADGTDSAAPIVHRDRFELWHFGSVYGNRTPVALLTAIAELDEAGAVARGALRLRFVGLWGGADPASARLASRLEERGFITREAPIPHRECLRQMRVAPALLAIQPAFPLQVPAKIYEYVASGRPILVVGGEGATAQLVDQHGLGRCCPDRVDALKALLTDLVDGRVALPAPDPSARAAFRYSHLTSRLATALDAAVAHRHPRADVLRPSRRATTRVDEHFMGLPR